MKKTRNILGLFSGFGLIGLGSWLSIIGIKESDYTGKFWLLLYGIIFIGVGIYMFYNLKDEDKIEQIIRRRKR